MPLRSTLNYLLKHPLARRRPLYTLLHYAYWQISTRVQAQPLVVSWIGGTRLWFQRNWLGISGNLYTGLHEFAEMAFVLHLLRPGDHFVDVGANMGSYTLLASGVCGAYTYSFEPHPDTFNHLLANIQLNQLQTHCQAQQVALGAHSGTAYLRQSARDTLNHIASSASADTLEVPIQTLDEAVSQPCQLLKIDVEGFEYAVLQGAQQHLQNPELLAILIEVNGQGQRYERSDQEVHQILLEAGFQAYRYDAFGRGLERMEGFEGQNTLYVRDLEAVRERVKKAEKRKVLNRWV